MPGIALTHSMVTSEQVVQICDVPSQSHLHWTCHTEEASNGTVNTQSQLRLRVSSRTTYAPAATPVGTCSQSSIVFDLARLTIELPNGMAWLSSG